MSVEAPQPQNTTEVELDTPDVAAVKETTSTQLAAEDSILPVESKIILKPSDPSATTSRLYISNVSYHTGESDLYDFVKDFDVVSILVPSHTVRGFKHSKQQSLGIAYIDFSTPEEAERAKESLNGKVLDKRPLRVKSFIPYVPKRVKVGPKKEVSKGKSEPSTAADIEETSEAIPFLTSESGDSNTENGDQVSPKATAEEIDEKVTTATSQDPPLSDDTVFISRLSPMVTDSDLRSYFGDYGPTEVYIFKSRYTQGTRAKSFFRHRQYVSALITLSTENGLSNALAELKGKKLKGHRVGCKASYLSKIEEVKNAAKAQNIQVQKVEKDSIPTDVLASASSVECCLSSLKNTCESDAESSCKCDNQISEKQVDDEMELTGAPVEPVN